MVSTGKLLQLVRVTIAPPSASRDVAGEGGRLHPDLSKQPGTDAWSQQPSAVPALLIIPVCAPHDAPRVAF